MPGEINSTWTALILHEFCNRVFNLCGKNISKISINNDNIKLLARMPAKGHGYFCLYTKIWVKHTTYGSAGVCPNALCVIIALEILDGFSFSACGVKLFHAGKTPVLGHDRRCFFLENCIPMPGRPIPRSIINQYSKYRLNN
jgi:hypothetical protein